jgi:hypothetical protein
MFQIDNPCGSVQEPLAGAILSDVRAKALATQPHAVQSTKQRRAPELHSASGRQAYAQAAYLSYVSCVVACRGGGAA